MVRTKDSMGGVDCRFKFESSIHSCSWSGEEYTLRLITVHLEVAKLTRVFLRSIVGVSLYVSLDSLGYEMINLRMKLRQRNKWASFTRGKQRQVVGKREVEEVMMISGNHTSEWSLVTIIVLPYSHATLRSVQVQKYQNQKVYIHTICIHVSIAR